MSTPNNAAYAAPAANDMDRTAHRAALMAAAGGPRDLALGSKNLAAWLEGRLGQDVTVSNLRVPIGAGLANETLLFEASYAENGQRRERGLVARVKPEKVQLFPDPDFENLFKLLKTLREEKLVKAPPVIWYEPGREVLGSPFFVMEQLKANVPISQPVYTAHGWLAEATPEQRRTVWRTAIEALAEIHTTPGEKVAFIGWPQYGETGEDQQFGYWENYKTWLGHTMPDEVLQLGEWIEKNRPHEPGVYLHWGDARYGNMMFGPDFRLQAVLDWDQMALAHPRHDLAWWLHFNDHYSTGVGVPLPEGMGDNAETIALWEELTGIKAGDLTWHNAYVQYKLSLISSRTFTATGAPFEKIRPQCQAMAKRALDILGAS